MDRIRRNLFIVCIIVMTVFVSTAILTAAVVNPSILRTHYSNRGVPVDAYYELRSPTILTTSYVATDVAQIRGFASLGLYLEIVQGSLTSFQYTVQWSHDNTTWYDEVTETVAAGVVTDTTMYYTLTLGGDVNMYKPLPITAQYLRVAVKGTGTVTASSCAVYVYGRY